MNADPTRGMSRWKRGSIVGVYRQGTKDGMEESKVILKIQKIHGDLNFELIRKVIAWEIMRERRDAILSNAESARRLTKTVKELEGGE